MGYSPGNFKATNHAMPVHWELRHGTHVVLWTSGEESSLVLLDYEAAKEASEQLSLLVSMMEE